MNSKEKKQIQYDVLYYPLVGRLISIVESRNESLKGLKGTIIFETKYDLLIETQNGSIKRIRKDIIGFNLEYKGKLLYMDGCLLHSTLLNRLKKVK